MHRRPRIAEIDNELVYVSWRHSENGDHIREIERAATIIAGSRFPTGRFDVTWSGRGNFVHIKFTDVSGRQKTFQCPPSWHRNYDLVVKPLRKVLPSFDFVGVMTFHTNDGMISGGFEF